MQLDNHLINLTNALQHVLDQSLVKLLLIENDQLYCQRNLQEVEVQIGDLLDHQRSLESERYVNQQPLIDLHQQS